MRRAKSWRDALNVNALALKAHDEPRTAQALRRHAREARFSRSQIHNRQRIGQSARLLPILRRPFAHPHRFHPVHHRRRPDLSGHFAGQPAALRGKPEAWRALRRDPARRPAVAGRRGPAPPAKLRSLHPRPQPQRALHRPQLRAAARRPRGPADRLGQHAKNQRRHLSRRRPQPVADHPLRGFFQASSAATGCNSSAMPMERKSGAGRSTPSPN